MIVHVLTILFLLLFAPGTSPAQSSLSWQTTGLYGGTIMQILRHPDGSLVAACKYRSTDEGITWNRIPGGGSASFSILPDGTLFQPAGLSSDWGKTWIHTGFGGGGQGTIHAVASDSAGNLYVGCESTFFSKGILYRSTDRGMSWIEQWRVDSRRQFVQNIVVSPHGDIYAGGGSGGLSYSTDSGKTWTGMEWGSGWCSVTPTKTRGEIFMGTDWGYTARCTEYGSWVMSKIPVFENATIYTFCFTIDSTEVLAGTNDGVYASTDRGLTWEKRSEELDFPTVYTLKTLENGEILAGVHTGGILRSTDRGRTWKNSNTGCTGMRVENLAVSSKGDLYASSYASIFHSSDHGETWRVITSGIPGSGMDVGWALFLIRSLTVDHQGYLYFGTQPCFTFRGDTLTESYLYRSTNKGDTWSRLNYPVFENYPRSYFSSVAVNREGAIFVADESRGIFRSTDNGDSWEQVWQALLDTSLTTVNKVLASSDGVLLAGLRNGMQVSTDNGDSWVQFSNRFWNIFDLAEGPDGHYVAAANSSVLRSSDNGVSWQETPGVQFPDGTRATHVSIEVHDNGYMFVATIGDGMWASDDGGVSWQHAGIENVRDSFKDVVIDTAGYVYTATLHSGVFRSVDPLTVVGDDNESSKPTLFLLSAPYPNPFNPTTTISYSLPHSEHVSLNIYDVLGREIVALVNEKREAGSYQVTWNAGNSPSGIYLCRMRAGGFGETRKLLLLR